MKTKEKTLLQTILDWSKPVKWNNKYDKPEGYEYDEDGIIETKTPINFITTNTGEYSSYIYKELNPTEFCTQNIIAVKLLNQHLREDRVLILAKYLDKQAPYSIGEDQVELLFKVTEADEEKLTYNWCRPTTIWRSSWSNWSNTRTATIRVKQREKYIDTVRDDMPLTNKYVTKEVAKETEFPEKTINRYFKDYKGWTKKDRTMKNLEDAYILLTSFKVSNPTQEQVAAASGVSIRTIKNYWNSLLSALNS